MADLPYFKWVRYNVNYLSYPKSPFSLLNQNENVLNLISFETISSKKDRVEKGAALAGFKRCLDACLILKSPVMISSRSVRRRSSEGRITSSTSSRSSPPIKPDHRRTTFEGAVSQPTTDFEVTSIAYAAT